MNRALQFLAVCVVLSLSPAVTWSQGSSITQPLTTVERTALSASRDLLDQGKKVAGSACASCHGNDGISTKPGVPHIAGQRTVYLYRTMQAYQSRERRSDEMIHTIGFLNEDALLAVSAYYASLVPARPKPLDEKPGMAVELTAGDPFTGIQGDMKKCVKCHGKDGNASGSGMPNLTAQSTEYYVTSMTTYLNQERGHKVMAKLAAGLDEDTLHQMGVFYAVQEPFQTTTTGDGNPKAGQSISEPCASCHGADGNASGADMPTLAGQDARYFVKAMKAYQTGKRQHEKMFEAVELLNDADINDLATFYALQEPVRRNVRTPLTTNEWIVRCERCHGLDGNSTDPRFPMLAGQDQTYLANALQAYIGGSRNSTTMHAMARPLSESDIAGIVQFFSTREPKSVLYTQLPCEELMDD